MPECSTRDYWNTVKSIATECNHEISWEEYPDVDDDARAEYCGACDTLYSRLYCYMTNEAIEGEINSRQYAPFEAYANEINSLGEWYSAEAWDDYDEGVHEGATKEIAKRLDAWFIY